MLFDIPDIPSNKESELKNQKKDPVLNIVYGWITEDSHPVVKTPEISASSVFGVQSLHYKSVKWWKFGTDNY